jgi:hypothetical protein
VLKSANKAYRYRLSGAIPVIHARAYPAFLLSFLPRIDRLREPVMFNTRLKQAHVALQQQLTEYQAERTALAR